MKAPYHLSDKIGTRATLGLIVLQSDETLEQEFRRYFSASNIALYVSRVPSGADVTPETLAAMEQEIPTAAGLLPPSLDYDVIGYGCTSGSMVIGPSRVEDLIQSATNVAQVTNPLSAAIAAFHHLAVARIGLLTPYIESVTDPMRDAFEAAGVAVAEVVSFGEAQEAKVARIDQRSITQAAETFGPGIDAVFLSCTNLRTLDVIDPIETALRVPVVSSNQALAWHMAQLAGTRPDFAVGRLLTIG